MTMISDKVNEYIIAYLKNLKEFKFKRLMAGSNSRKKQSGSIFFYLISEKTKREKCIQVKKTTGEKMRFTVM